MISWEEHKMQMPPWEVFSNKEKTNIQCPKCGEPLYKRNDIVLTSYPPQFQYECDKCNWIGYAFT